MVENSWLWHKGPRERRQAMPFTVQACCRRWMHPFAGGRPFHPDVAPM